MRGVTDRSFGGSYMELFQPALPMRGVTRRIGRWAGRALISTRTPHAGSDTPCNRQYR